MSLDAPSFTSDLPPDDTSTTTTYPSPPPLAPLSSLFGYTESDRARYTTLQSTATTRLLSLPLTPTELAGLTYYDGIFYAYESYGDVFGTTAGVLLGLALRARKPGRIPAAIAHLLKINPQYVAVTLRVGIFGSLGRLYGLTTAGVQGLNRMRREQKEDPNMDRIIAARAQKIGAIEREIRARAFGNKNPQQDHGQEQDDQSLGGMEIFDQQRRADEGAAGVDRNAFPFGRPSEAVVSRQTPSQPDLERQAERGDDPFSFGDEKEAAAAPARGGWKNQHSNTSEGAWERLRKGQLPNSNSPSDERPESGSPWPKRQPMNGFAQADEPKTDSFSFSSTAEDRELAKAQAQREFDESVERERRSGGDGGADGYSEGDQGRGGRRRW